MVGAGCQKGLHAYLPPSQLSVDQDVHLALRPLHSGIIQELVESGPGNHGDLSDRERSHASAQPAQWLSPVVIRNHRPDDLLLHLGERNAVVQDTCSRLNTGRCRYGTADRLYLFDCGVVALVQLRQELLPELRGQIWSVSGVTGQHSEPEGIRMYSCSPDNGVAHHHKIISTAVDHILGLRTCPCSWRTHFH